MAPYIPKKWTSEKLMELYSPKKWTSDQSIEALSVIVAQESSGLEGAIPEQDDQNLALFFIKVINSEARHHPEFISRVSKIFS